jgi:hypothetical protein
MSPGVHVMSPGVHVAAPGVVVAGPSVHGTVVVGGGRVKGPRGKHKGWYKD